MQTKKFFHLLLLIVFTFTITSIFTIGNAIKIIRAAPPFQGPPQYEEVYQVLEDGTIIITRVEISPEQIQATATCTQSAPILLEPPNGSQIDTLIPDYVWEQVSNEVFRYNLQVSEFPDFSVLDNSAYFLTSYPSAGSPYRGWSRSNLVPDTIYYWRVASVCEDTDEEGPFSPAFSFKSAPAGGIILPAPNLLAPDDGVTVGSTQVTFSLESVDGAVKYNYRFFHSSANDWEGWFRWIGSSGNTVTTIFDPEETIYWRAAAMNDYAIGTPSMQRSFVTPDEPKIYLPIVLK